MRGNGILLDDIKSRDMINEYLKSVKYKNIICSSSVAMPIQDSVPFSAPPINKSSNAKGIPYLIGEIYGIKTWVDPYMRFNDNTILFFDKC